MQAVSVHIAVLAVGKDAAPTQTISEVATGAGHEVVGRATVNDTQGTIRAQLQRWIDDANVDVIIVSGGMESENTTAALKPLITQTLPGFTDLFRYLAFQEIGASAMLSNAEAAQCGSTFVFVLPAAAGAVKAAMEKLILPQLDSNTTPKNLVSSMPRIRNTSQDGIPLPIVKEKTASGSGLTPKMPSGAIRARSHTGGNVIRKLDASFDPPTKPIDVAKLEAQIALSESSHSETKQVDLSRLPKVPPGADPLSGDTLSDDTDQIEPGDITRTSRRMESQPIEPPAPTQRRKIQRTDLAAVVPPPRGGLLPDPPAPRGPVSLPDSGHAPVAPLPTVPAIDRNKPPTEPPPARLKHHSGPQIAVPSVIPKSPSGSVRKPATQPPPVAKRPPTQPPPRPPRPPTGPAPTVKPASMPFARRPPTEPPPPPPPAAKRPPTEPPPPAPSAKRPPTEPPPPPAPVAKRPPTEPPPPPAPVAKRSPTAPPPAPAARPITRPPPVEADIGALVETPLRRSGELPAGTFNYPVQRSGPSKLVLVLLGLFVIGVGFAAFVFLFPKHTAPVGNPAPQPDVVAAAPADAAVDSAVVIDAAAEPDIAMEPTDPAPPDPTPPTPTPATRPTTTARPPRGTTRPTTGGTPVTTPAGGSAQEPEDTVENAPNNPAPTASDCDEVSCVLSKYDRPCCEKYRPKDSGIAQRTAGGVPAELDKSMVRAGIEKVKPRVVACGEQSSAKGIVKIAVKVTPAGDVAGASVAASPDGALGDCVAAAIKKATFTKTVAGGSFTYPFTF